MVTRRARRRMEAYIEQLRELADNPPEVGDADLEAAINEAQGRVQSAVDSLEDALHGDVI